MAENHDNTFFGVEPADWPDLYFASPQWLASRRDGIQGPRGAFLFLPHELRNDIFHISQPLPARLVEPYGALVAKVEDIYLRAAEYASHLPKPFVRTGRDTLLWLDGGLPPRRLADTSPAPDALPAIANALAASLSPLHEQGIFHLDLHPDVIGLTESDAVVLHGVSVDTRREVARLAADNQRLARPRFSAPELWDGSGDSALGASTDVYAASATLYFCIMGQAPPDFRDRLNPRNARDDIAASLQERLGADRLATRGMAEAIADGLSPRAKDRPQDIRTWSEAFATSGKSGPAPTVTSAAVGAKTAPRAEPSAVARTSEPTPRRHGKAILAVVALMIAGGVFAATFRDHLPTRRAPAGPAKGPSIPIPDLVAAAPKPTPAWPTGELAGVRYEDDPEALKLLLHQHGAPQAMVNASGLLLGPFRDHTDLQCETPLRLHLRADGRGFVIQRPAPLVWVTEWSATKVGAGIGLTIQSVIGEDGPIDAPGLVAASRTFMLEKGELSVAVYTSAQDIEREIYLPCR